MISAYYTGPAAQPFSPSGAWRCLFPGLAGGVSTAAVPYAQSAYVPPASVVLYENSSTGTRAASSWLSFLGNIPRLLVRGLSPKPDAGPPDNSPFRTMDMKEKLQERIAGMIPYPITQESRTRIGIALLGESRERLEEMLVGIGRVERLLEEARTSSEVFAERADEILRSEIEKTSAGKNFEKTNLIAWMHEARAATIMPEFAASDDEKRQAYLRRAGMYQLALQAFNESFNPRLSENARLRMVEILIQAFSIKAGPGCEVISGEKGPEFTQSESRIFRTVNPLHEHRLRTGSRKRRNWRILCELRTFMPEKLTAEGTAAFLDAWRTQPLVTSAGVEFPYPFGSNPVDRDSYKTSRKPEELRAIDTERRYIPDKTGERLGRGGQQSVYEGPDGTVIKCAWPHVAERMHVVRAFLEAYDIPHLSLASDELAMKLARHGITIQERLPRNAINYKDMQLSLEEMPHEYPDPVHAFLRKRFGLDAEGIDALLEELRREITGKSRLINDDETLKREADLRTYLVSKQAFAGYEGSFFTDVIDNFYFIPNGYEYDGRIVHWVLVDW